MSEPTPSADSSGTAPNPDLAIPGIPASSSSSPKPPGKPITDISHPSTSAPSDNSRSSVINHSRVKDPMMVTAPASDSNPDSDDAERLRFKASSKRVTLQPLSVPLPKTDVKPGLAATPTPAPVVVEPPKLASERSTATSMAKTPETTGTASSSSVNTRSVDLTSRPGNTNLSPGDSTKQSAKSAGQTPEEAEEAARIEHEAGIQKLIDGKQYFLPITGVEQQRNNKRFILVGVVLSLLLAVGWLDMALDAGLLNNTGIPHTHFFALKVKLAAPATPAVTSSSATTSKPSCGTIKVTDATVDKSPYVGCFDTKFASCSPAQIKIDIESTFGKGTILEYSIKSKVATGCNVEWQYVALPSNPKWNGQTITCTYDNTKDFNTAFSAKSDTTGCTGPLVKLMQPQNTSSDSSSSGTSTTGTGNSSTGSTSTSSGSTSTTGNGTSTGGGTTTCTNSDGSTSTGFDGSTPICN